MTLTHGELFAGISGFGLGFQRAGLPVSWAVEIDPDCRTILRRHHADALVLEDVREVGAHNLPRVDVISFGSPCQDLSVAGKRAGLDGARSGLFFEAIRIIRELRPRFAVWENVPGALSSNGGRDFGAALDALADAGALDIAWSVLDAQWFGLAQRRKRVFVVADFGGERAAEILSLGESGAGDPPPRRETRQGTARSAAYSVAVRGRDDGAEWELGAPEVGNALRAGDGGSSRANWAVVPTLAACKTRREGKGPDSDATTTLIPEIAGTLGSHTSFRGDLDSCGAYIPTLAHTLRAEGFDASGDGTGRGTPLVPVAFAQNTRDEVRLIGGDGAIAGALASQPGMKQTTYVAQAVSFEPRYYTRDNKTGGAPSETATLTSQQKAGDSTPHVQQGMAVRRLTPTECCRLQGFPDDWLDGLSDSAKYRMLGNAVAVPVAEWIGRRILEDA